MKKVDLLAPETLTTEGSPDKMYTMEANDLAPEKYNLAEALDLFGDDYESGMFKI